ncbi:MAG: hypothetical protein K2X50_10170 [Gammaproteobacteria bacterium]|nr:hypothetical protein [Gammaproteobacteria bacterium]
MTSHITTGLLMSIYNQGIFIIGPSGIGKSELALNLIDRGHQLVSDDAVTLEKEHDQIVGSSPNILFGCLNIRELGVIHVEQYYGVSSLCKKHVVDLIIDLLPHEPKQSLNPLMLEYTTHSLLDTELPYVQLTTAPSRNLALLIELATMQSIQRKKGFDFNQTFIAKTNENMGQPS